MGVNKAFLVYRNLFSRFMLPCCRFEPTCSEYAREALLALGFWKGSWLAMRRILRCQPLARAGYDPVPVTVHKERR
ncbi:MAG: membrane protein insertion efficiency factor YidD [Candidatus Omnitrophica bacterium]|nr:membrane protein insertion efficiency factor YidD [Candidatus Omnitrophota bacterium]